MAVAGDGNLSVHATHVVEKHSMVLCLLTHFVDTKENGGSGILVH
jgi:hypothetical protein